MFSDRKKKGQGTMKKLYSIMEHLLELDYKQETSLLVLRALEASLSEETQTSSKMFISHTKWQIEAHNKELKEQIKQLDIYISEQK